MALVENPSAENLRESWKQHCPPTVRFNDFRKVAARYFPDSCSNEHGSHKYFVVWPKWKKHRVVLESACGDILDVGGRLSVPTINGREVERTYVKLLLKAIDAWEKYDEYLK